MIDISFCQRAEIPALIEFIRDYWKNDHIFVKQPEFLHWHYDHRRFRDVPEGGLSFLLARDSGKIVGVIGLNEVGFNVFGEKGPSVWPSIWYAHPEYRRHFIGARLWQQVVKLRYSAICMIGMNPTVRPFFNSLGYEMLVNTPRWCGVLDPAGAEKFLAENPDANATEIRALVESMTLKNVDDPRESSALEDLELCDWNDSIGSAWDESWNETFAPTMVGTDKTAEYLSWRYQHHPIFQYRIRLAKAAKDPTGLIVTRLETPRDRSETILRVIELLGDPASLRVLVADELRRAREENALFADFHCASRRFAQPLESLGFQQLDAEGTGALVPHRFQPLQFGRIPLTSAYHLAAEFRGRVPRLLACEDFHISRADGDQDRPN
jgi:GNAT superfamily N-acetyltransferase